MRRYEFAIPVSELDAGGKEYHFTVRAGWIRGALEDHEATAAGTDGELSARLSTSGTDVVVHGTLRAELQVPCARCLNPVRFHVNQPLYALMVPASQLKGSHRGDEMELTAEEAEIHAYDGETVVLDDLVRDELVLETPMIPLCSEQCPGIRPPPTSSSQPELRAGQDVDPRLAPLLRFRQNLKKE